MSTQCQKIVEYIKKFGSISTLEAFNDLGCVRLASRICDLKRQGYEIHSNRVKGKNRFGETIYYNRYYFPGSDDQQNN